MSTEMGVIFAACVVIAWAAVWAYRKPWGCRIWLHHWEDAFPATYSHLECTKCGKRCIPAKNHHPNAPVDLHWLETGQRRVRVPPRQPKKKEVA